VKGINPWLLLTIAGLLEIVFAFGLKHSSGPHKAIVWPITGIAMAGSFFLLATAMKQLPAGTSYAVWTGIGAAGTALVGMLIFGEPKTAARFGFIALIIGGVVGLQLSSNSGGH
jgi:quaternary ammonium compound-resistance protein SugE